MQPYLGLVNYTSNLRRLGWTEADLSGAGSDALVDALVAHGSPAEVAGQLTRHLAAGADHVCLQLITERGRRPAALLPRAGQGAGTVVTSFVLIPGAGRADDGGLVWPPGVGTGSR